MRTLCTAALLVGFPVAAGPALAEPAPPFEATTMAAAEPALGAKVAVELKRLFEGSPQAATTTAGDPAEPQAAIPEAAIPPPLPDGALAFYRERGHRPIWIGDDGIRPAAKALVDGLRNAVAEGLEPAAYRPAMLADRLTAAGSPAELAELERDLTAALLRYARDLRTGRLAPSAVEPNLYPDPPAIDLQALLADAILAPDTGRFLAEMAPTRPAYQALRRTLTTYRALDAKGGWPEVPGGGILNPGDNDPRIKALRRRLRASGDLTEGSDASPLFDAAVDQALRRFQTRHGLKVDGSLGPSTLAALNVPLAERIQQILVNMERLRWAPERLADRYVQVNLPAAELEVWEDGKLAVAMRVVVGQTGRQTPVFAARMTQLVLNPVWNVPRHLAVEDVLAKVRKDQGYLAKQGIRVLQIDENGQDGAEIDPTKVNWSRLGKNRFPYRLRQDPGPRNAMGRIKFLIPNRDDIFLHDTPQRTLFDKAVRTDSSGCIRLENPIQLATYALRDRPEWTTERIEAALSSQRTENIRIKTPLPVFLIYRTAWVGADGLVHFRPDIYQRDKVLSGILSTKS